MQVNTTVPCLACSNIVAVVSSSCNERRYAISRGRPIAPIFSFRCTHPPCFADNNRTSPRSQREVGPLTPDPSSDGEGEQSHRSGMACRAGCPHPCPLSLRRRGVVGRNPSGPALAGLRRGSAEMDLDSTGWQNRFVAASGVDSGSSLRYYIVMRALRRLRTSAGRMTYEILRAVRNPFLTAISCRSEPPRFGLLMLRRVLDRRRRA
jgi:hypothetical protein